MHFIQKKDEVRDKISDAPDIADFDKKFPNIARSIQSEISELYNEADELLHKIIRERHSLKERYTRLYSLTSEEEKQNLKSPETFKPTYRAIGQARPVLGAPTTTAGREKVEQKSTLARENEKTQLAKHKDEHKPT